MILSDLLGSLNRNLEKDYAMGDLEARIAANAVAPRVTEKDVLESIQTCFFVNAWDAATQDVTVSVVGAEKVIPEELKVITLALVTTKSGFTVVGVSGCADPANFNRDIGEEIAKRNAVSQLWGHMGFELRSRLHEEEENRRQENDLLEAEKAFREKEAQLYEEDVHAIGSMDE